MPHVHEQIDFTVEVFVVSKGKVLLRKHDKYNVWLGVGGHIDLGEDPEEAALREVKEETGLAVTLLGDPPRVDNGRESYRELLAPRFMNRHAITDTHEHVTLVYFAVSESSRVTPEHEGDRSDAWMWLSRDELDRRDDVLDSIAFYAREALREAENMSL